MSYEVRNEEIENLLKRLGAKMVKEMPEGWGFTFLLFSYGQLGELYYLSTAMREDMIRVMEEFIRREHAKQ